MLLFETTASLIIALGKTIIHSVWIGLLILAVLRMVLLAIPERHSHQRYLVSVASMVLLAASVLATFVLLYSPASYTESSVRVFEAQRFVPYFLIIEPTSGSAWEPNLLFTLCSYIYFAGMIFMVLRSVFSYRYIKKLRKSGQGVSAEWQETLKRFSKLLGINREVSFLQSDKVSGPLMIGLLKPAVIVPVGMFTHLSPAQVETILMHELYHLKRLDYLINILQVFMEGVLFYNPALWYISDRIRQEREHSCDDAVVQTSQDPVNYARALVQLAEQQAFTSLVPGAGGSSKNHLVTRIRRIINKNDMKKNMQERVMSLLLFVGAIMLVVVISGFSSGFSIIKQDNRIPEKNAQVVFPANRIPDSPVQDTIRNTKKEKESPEDIDVDWDEIKEEMEAARTEAMEEIDWDEIKEEMEAARIEVMEEIDWDEIKEEMEAARIEVMEEIDWDEIKEEMEAARTEAMEEIDWDQIKIDIETARIDVMENIDWDKMKSEMDSVRLEIEEIDWEEIKQEMQRSISEMHIDMEEMKREIEESIKEIDLDEIRIDMENTRRDLDSKNIEKDI